MRAPSTAAAATVGCAATALRATRLRASATGSCHEARAAQGLPHSALLVACTRKAGGRLHSAAAAAAAATHPLNLLGVVSRPRPPPSMVSAE